MESKGSRVFWTMAQMDKDSDDSMKFLQSSGSTNTQILKKDQQVFYLAKNCDLAGGFKHFFFKTLPGEMIPFDFCIFFKWVETNHQPVMETWAIFFSDLLVEVTVPNGSFFVRERSSMSASPDKKMAETFRLRIQKIHCPDTCTRTYSNYRYVLTLGIHIFVTCQTKNHPIGVVLNCYIRTFANVERR